MDLRNDHLDPNPSLSGLSPLGHLGGGVCSSSSFFNMSLVPVVFPAILPIPSEHLAIACVSTSLTLLPKHLQAKCQAQTGLLMPISSAILWTQLIGWAGALTQPF